MAAIFDVAESWLPATLLTLVPLGCAVGAAAGGAACKPTRCCGRQTPATGWGILIGTIGIQLGWAIRATFDNSTKRVALRKDHPAAIDLLLMAAMALLTAAVLVLTRGKSKRIAPVDPSDDSGGADAALTCRSGGGGGSPPGSPHSEEASCFSSIMAGPSYGDLELTLSERSASVMADAHAVTLMRMRLAENEHPPLVRCAAASQPEPQVQP